MLINAALHIDYMTWTLGLVHVAFAMVLAPDGTGSWAVTSLDAMCGVGVWLGLVTPGSAEGGR